jgi:O-antigen biosynthesis protein
LINDEFHYENRIDLRDSNHSLTKIIQRIKENSNILEFGPAKGILTKYLKEELNCKITCVEIDEKLAKLASLYSEKVIVADIDKLDFPAAFGKEKFDTIIFPDVLEHLYDPWRIIREAKNYLQDDGKIIASIPNIAHASVILSLLDDEFQYNPSGLLDKTHIRFFTKKSIYNFFESNGFYIEEIDFTKANWKQTEFIFTTKQFPESLISFINEKPEREIYQYIVVAKKTDKDFSKKFETQEKIIQAQREDYVSLENELKTVYESTSYRLFLKLGQLRKFFSFRKL